MNYCAVFKTCAAHDFSHASPNILPDIVLCITLAIFGRAGVSAKLQHYRLTSVVGPCDRDVSCLMRLLAGRAPGGSILSGSCRTTLGGTYSGCRSVIGYATSVSTPPLSILVFTCCQPAATGIRIVPSGLDTCLYQMVIASLHVLKSLLTMGYGVARPLPSGQLLLVSSAGGTSV